MTNPVILRVAALVLAASAAVAGCGSTSSGGDTPRAVPAATPSSVPTPASSPLVGPTLPPGTTPTLSAQQVADTGLPSKVGPGKLSNPTIKRLMQFFEDKVSRAYATGNADALSHYLAGPMLTGNRGTINLLSSQHRRNVFKIRVQTVKAEANTGHRIILDMTGDMTVNYFFDPRTHKVLNNGLPGASQVTFTVFLDQNPATGTWYWTGEKSGTGGVTGAQTVG
jgi:hypothetical protein